MPTIDLIEQKKRDVQAALNYEYKEEDIDRIIEEKNRFRAYPTNFAMKKTQLMKVRWFLLDLKLILNRSFIISRNVMPQFCRDKKKQPMEST